MSLFTPMTKVLEPIQVGSVRLERFNVPQVPVRAAWHPNEYVEPGEYMRLLVGGQLMMSDTWFEHRTNMTAVIQAKGNVLIAGLGLGMIAVPIMQKPGVRCVTIVEKSPDVIAAVEPQLREYLARLEGAQDKGWEVIQGDIFNWNYGAARWDTIYFDIWGDISTDALEEMAKLKRRFARRLDRPGWMGCWRQEELRAARRNGGRF